jgi:DNA-binding LacI/PurR family transcriptional regulator/DNA-binding transcriptional regulator YhcF (GntR family)
MTDFTPAYFQIKTDIKKKIATGYYKPGEALPGRNALSEHYQCSWSTLNRAINELILEGVLVAERGKGTYVSSFSKTLDQQKDDENAIKVWFCHPFPSVYSNLFEMMEGMRKEADDRGSRVSFISTGEQPQSLNKYIVVTPSNAQFNDLAQAWHRGEKFIVLNSSFEEAPFPTIDADIYTASKQALQLLFEHNHQKIGLLGIRYGFSNYEKRVAAYRDAFKEAELSYRQEWILDRSENVEDAKRIYQDWMKQFSECTAIFAADYTTSMVVLEVTAQLGINIPQDISLFGVGTSPFSSALKVSPSAILQPFHDMGKLAIARVIDEVWHTDPLMMPCQLIEGNSVSKCSDN